LKLLLKKKSEEAAQGEGKEIVGKGTRGRTRAPVMFHAVKKEYSMDQNLSDFWEGTGIFTLMQENFSSNGGEKKEIESARGKPS